MSSCKLAEAGGTVRLLTRWPTIAMETTPDVYLHWMLTYVYQAGFEMSCDRFVQRIEGTRVTVFNIYNAADTRVIDADWIVMATGRQSENSVYHTLPAAPGSRPLATRPRPAEHTKQRLKGIARRASSAYRQRRPATRLRSSAHPQGAAPYDLRATSTTSRPGGWSRAEARALRADNLITRDDKRSRRAEPASPACASVFGELIARLALGDVPAIGEMRVAG